MRFTLSFHDTDESHYDLFMESKGDDLLSTITFLPDEMTNLTEGKPAMGEESFPHRKIYLDFEGDIGDHRGTVKIIDRGDYCVVESGGYSFNGTLLNGTATIIKNNKNITMTMIRGAKDETDNSQEG